jgi:periplasmic divalent cation tolerance protein
MSSTDAETSRVQPLRDADQDPSQDSGRPGLVLVSCLAEGAQAIAAAVVEERLAACVSILPHVTSIYHWQGEVHKDSEALLLIKTNSAQWNALEQRIKQLHSYEVPEIIFIPIELGHAPYLDWLNNQVGQRNAPSRDNSN